MANAINNVTWLKIQNFFKFAWEWLKHNWLVVVLFIGVIVALVFGAGKMKSYEELLKEYQDQIRKSHEDLAALQAVQQQQEAQQQVINQQYNDTLTKISQQYSIALSSLSDQKKQDLQNIIKANHDNPVVMAQQVNELFGLPIFVTPATAVDPVLSAPPTGHP